MISLDQNCGITQLREAAGSGNIEKIRAILSEWREHSADSELFVENAVPVLSDAIEHDSVEVVESLLEYHVPMNPLLVLKATRNTSYRILQALFNHGWDINTPIDPYTPPSSCVSSIITYLFFPLPDIILTVLVQFIFARQEFDQMVARPWSESQPAMR